MQTFNVYLSSINSVKQFTNAACRCADCEIDVASGRYIVDAKSIMGLFSLDLSKPVHVEYHGDDAGAESFKQEIAALICD